MNCGLLGDNHKHSPYQRIHIEIFHFVLWLAFELLSQVRVHFLEVWNASTRYAVIVRPLRVVLVVDFGIFCCKFSHRILENWDPGSFLQQRASSHCRSFFASVSHTMRTRRCVILVWTSSGKFPCTLSYEIRTLLTGCSEYPRTIWCTRTRRCRRAGFDLATILSSPVPCCILFDIASGQLAELELKILILNRWRRLFHSSRVKLPFVSMSASWFLVSTCLVWFWIQVDSVKKKPIKRNSCEFGIRVSLLDFCPWWSSWSLLHHLQKCRASHQIEKTSRLRKHDRRCMVQDRCAELESSFGSWCVFLMVWHAAGFPAHSLWIS